MILVFLAAGYGLILIILVLLVAGIKQGSLWGNEFILPVLVPVLVPVLSWMKA